MDSASRAVHEPQPGFQPQAFLTWRVEHAPAATQVCTSASVTALQMQMYTAASVGLTTTTIWKEQVSLA